jgi:hypothetical protein
MITQPTARRAQVERRAITATMSIQVWSQVERVIECSAR